MPLSSEHGPGTDSPILMCEGDVNRGPLKNDVSISMLILACTEKKHVFLKSRMGHPSSKKHTQGFGRSPGRESRGLGWGLWWAGWNKPAFPPTCVVHFWKTALPGACLQSNVTVGLPVSLPRALEIKTPKLLN